MTRIPLAFLLSALAIRLIGFNTSAIWFDEAVSKYRAQLPLAAYAGNQLDYTGMNLWELILRPFAHGPVWLLRVPSLLAAMGALWIAWLIMHELQFTRAQRITAAVPMVLLPGLIWPAQDARYYAVIGLLFIAAIYYAIKLRPIGLLACMGLLPYIQPIGPAYAIAALLVAWRHGMPFKRVMIVGALASIAWIPKMLQALGVFDAQRADFWLQAFGLPWILEQTAKAFDVNTLDLWGSVALLLLICIMLVRGIRPMRGILWLAVVVPAAILLIVSTVKPVYFYRPEQPTALALCLLAGVTLAPSASWRSWTLPALSCGLLVIMVANYGASARGGYIDASAAEIRRGWHAGDRIAYASLTVAVPYAYYLADLPGCLIDFPGLEQSDAFTSCELADLRSGTWLVWTHDPAVVPPQLASQLAAMTAGTLPVSNAGAWQFSAIDVYYLK